MERRLDQNIRGKLVPRMGNKIGLLSKIFANPDQPELDDYYEPFTYDYDHLKTPRRQSADRPSALTDHRSAHDKNRKRPELGR